MAPWYKQTPLAKHEESRARLLFERRGLRHELHDVPRLQGNVHTAQQLFGINVGRDAVMHDEELARVLGTAIISREHGLGQSQPLGPGDNMVPDLAIDGDTGPLSLLHSRHGLLL